jgi:hypothetical protein
MSRLFLSRNTDTQRTRPGPGAQLPADDRGGPEGLRGQQRVARAHLPGAAAVAFFSAVVLAEIYLCNVCSGQEMLRGNGRG